MAEKRAVDTYYRGNIEGSIREFEQILRLDPGDVSIIWELVRAYYETGEGLHAAALLENLHHRRPADPEAERELFLTLCLMGNYPKALAMLPLSRETSETLFYEAMIRRDMGERGKAIELLRKSLALENFRPIGWFILGELLAGTAPAEAETCFRTVLRQDSELRSVLFPLGSVLLAQKRYKEAYDYLSRAQNYFPGNDEIIRRLNEVIRFLPGIREPDKPTERRQIAATPPKVKALGTAAAGMAMVRIGLAEAQSSVTLKTGGPYKLRDANGEALFEGMMTDQLWAEVRNGKILIQDQQGRYLVIAERPVILEYRDPENTTTLSGFASEDRSYRGSIEFRLEKAGITLINILNIEEYLYGVIPSEMPASWPAEALKAQAIAARAYTLAYLGQYKEKGFDLYGSVLSAAYRGVGGESRATTAAVDATRGMYLRAGGKPFKAYYSANHGGYSENSISVWGDNTFNVAVADKLLTPRTTWLSFDALARWIREKPKSYSSVPNLHSSQAYRWEKWVPAEEIRSRNAEYGNVGEILQIISRGRGISGRINAVEIRGSRGSMRVAGDRIRSRLGGLRSNLFTIRSKMGKDGKPEYFIFQGAGWGHGVGLDQSGAAGMAQAGFTAAQILQHYYPLAELVK
jgi:SpoIID/LytB domain protein